MTLEPAGERPRVARLSRQIEHYRRLAEEAQDHEKSLFYLKLARSVESQRRLERAFPFKVWLWSVVPGTILLPWAILTHAGHPVLGVAAGVAVLILIVAAYLLRRKRSRQRTAQGDGRTTRRLGP
jgi:hypothetical protein